MAKSKSGGTRSYLRGRVGADVYSIGKDSKGKKQQVVRSLAETVANPQTVAQMRGRMIMFTVMQAVSAMSPIIDHSFDNVVAGQPSLSEFIRRNYALVKADVAAHPASGNSFGLNLYREKGIKAGAYEVSAGSAVLPAAIAIATSGARAVTITLPAGATFAQVKTALGMTADDFITAVGINDDGFRFARFRFGAELAEDAVISAGNVAQMFAIEGNVQPTVTFANNAITLQLADAMLTAGIIVSIKTTSGYQHNNCVLQVPTAPAATADVALITYPIGNAKFLNGGDLAGLSESGATSTGSGSGGNDDGPNGGDDEPNGSDDEPNGEG